MLPDSPHLHMRNGESHGHHGCGQIDVERAPEQRRVKAIDRAGIGHQRPRAGADARIGEQHVETAVPACRTIDRCMQGVGVRDVERGRFDCAAHRDEPGRVARKLRFVEVDHDNRRTVLRHDFRIREAKAARSAGHECDMAADVEQFGLLHGASPRAFHARACRGHPRLITLVTQNRRWLGRRPARLARTPTNPAMTHWSGVNACSISKERPPTFRAPHRA